MGPPQFSLSISTNRIALATSTVRRDERPPVWTPSIFEHHPIADMHSSTPTASPQRSGQITRRPCFVPGRAHRPCMLTADPFRWAYTERCSSITGTRMTITGGSFWARPAGHPRGWSQRRGVMGVGWITLAFRVIPSLPREPMGFRCESAEAGHRDCVESHSDQK